MIIDATLLLWRKCKDVFQRFQTGSTDNPKYLHKMDNPSKVSAAHYLGVISLSESQEASRLS